MDAQVVRLWKRSMNSLSLCANRRTECVCMELTWIVRLWMHKMCDHGCQARALFLVRLGTHKVCVHGSEGSCAPIGAQGVRLRTPSSTVRPKTHKS